MSHHRSLEKQAHPSHSLKSASPERKLLSAHLHIPDSLFLTRTRRLPRKPEGVGREMPIVSGRLAPAIWACGLDKAILLLNKTTYYFITSDRVLLAF